MPDDLELVRQQKADERKQARLELLESIQTIAAIQWAYFLHLQSEGFTEEQALDIVKNDGLMGGK